MKNNSTLLILGSTGAVGTAMETVSRERNIPCTPLSHQDIDITDTAQMLTALDTHHPDAVMNCVAMASIDPCEKEPEKALELHCTAVLHLAKECGRRGILLIQPSSHAVFDGLKEMPYTEEDHAKATSVYAATKLLSERIASAYSPKHYIARFPTLYGPRRNTGMGFVDKVIMWIREGRELRIADDKMDSPTYTLDAAHAVTSLILDNAEYGMYHIANEGWISYYDFVCKIREIMKAENVIHRARDREFSSICYKPLRTGLTSTKLKPLRRYEVALWEYMKTMGF
jgi:dTDP-4-dehydrorhamnose reductase